MATITEIRGNIFESSCQTLVNTVNCVGVMGKGIALEFKNRYPQMFVAYARLCEDGQLRPGLLYLWTKSTPWILNFPTKNHWKYPSKLEYIESGLKKFVETYAQKGISSIAFPELGTSSGGLDWIDVKDLMYRYLSPLPNLQLEIYHYDPLAQDTLFDKLFQKVHRFSIEDYKSFVGLNTRQAQIIAEAISSRRIHNMRDIQELEGIGEKTIEKLYSLVDGLETPRLVTQAERQVSLSF